MTTFRNLLVTKKWKQPEISIMSKDVTGTLFWGAQETGNNVIVTNFVRARNRNEVTVRIFLGDK
jgi:hypothetical protein